MIQELLGGTSGLLGERKIPINGGILQGTPCSSPPSSISSSYPATTASTTATTTAATTTNTTSTKTTSTNSESQNLRCPRCDSTNTKFCYYNNYNLTQPRHFCKTCRRYWTKGGALRNVPIGGGCRKNKNVNVSTPVAKASVGKLKTLPPEFGRSGLSGGGFDHEIPTNGIFWASPQNSHILALLRSAQNSNPNPNPVALKEEGGVIGSQLISEQTVSNGALNARTLGLDPLSHVPSLSLWGNNQQQQAQQQNGVIIGEVQNSGLQELYQRLKASTNYSNDHSHHVSNLVSSSSSSILESAPVAAGELSYWNPAFSWPDLPTTNGTYP